jgi:hypothetical protein
MKWVGLILILLLFGACEPEYEYGRLSFQTQDSTLLPIIIKLGINNTIDTITEVGNYECEYAEKYIDLIAPNSYEFRIFGNNFDSTRSVYVKENDCRMFTIKR